jgi:hypothetical protein
MPQYSRDSYSSIHFQINENNLIIVFSNIPKKTIITFHVIDIELARFAKLGVCDVLFCSSY